MFKEAGYREVAGFRFFGAGSLGESSTPPGCDVVKWRWPRTSLARASSYGVIEVAAAPRRLAQGEGGGSGCEAAKGVSYRS